jgi:hypothetical protein
MPNSPLSSAMSDVIQLTIWDRLSLATTNSVGADFLGLLTEVDESIEQLPLNDRLGAAGEAIRRLGEIYADRAAMQLSEIEYLFRPEQEPVMSLDAFDRYVRQSMVVDLEQFIEAPQLPEYEREYNLTVVRELSVTEALADIGDEVVSEEIEVARVADLVLGIAHGEEIELWAQRIREVMVGANEMLVVELQWQSGLSLVDVWLGLLLGDSEFRVWRQSDDLLDVAGDFYAVDGLLATIHRL